MPDVAVVLIRTLIAYLTLFLLARMMGKQVISQLTFFEFVVGITIGDLAANMAMDIGSVSFSEGLVAMLVMGGVTVILASAQVASRRARRWLEGAPTVLVRNGRILKENLRKERYTVQDLLSQLRLQQVFDLRQVQLAMLEPSGRLSVLKRQHFAKLGRSAPGRRRRPRARLHRPVGDATLRQALNHLHQAEALLRSYAERAPENRQRSVQAQGLGRIYQPINDGGGPNASMTSPRPEQSNDGF